MVMGERMRLSSLWPSSFTRKSHLPSETPGLGKHHARTRQLTTCEEAYSSLSQQGNLEVTKKTMFNITDCLTVCAWCYREPYSGALFGSLHGDTTSSGQDDNNHCENY